MSSIVIIEKELPKIKVWNDCRVVTFKDIDNVHQRPNGTAKRNFNRNKRHFIDGEDYFKVSADEIRTRKIFDISDKATEDYTLLTETGYLMIVKSFKDDLSWDVQRQLVNGYFRAKEIENSIKDNQTQPLIHTTLNRIPLPLKSEKWHYRNLEKLNTVCSYRDALYSEFYHHFLLRISKKWDISDIRAIFKAERGYDAPNTSDLIDHFPELRTEADEYLEALYRKSF